MPKATEGSSTNLKDKGKKNKKKEKVCRTCGGKNGQHTIVRVNDLTERYCWDTEEK